MEKRHVKVFHAGGDPAILARKIYFHDSIQRDVLFRLKLGTCLAEIVLWLHPTPEDSGMSFIEQSGTLSRNQNLYNLILLQRLTLSVNPRKNLLRCRRKWTRKFSRGRF